MLEPLETTIDGVEYRFMPLMTDPAREWLDRLIKAFGPSVASMLEGLQGADTRKLDLDTTEEMGLLSMLGGSFGKGLHSFTQSLTPAFHKELVDKFLGQVQYRTEDGNWAPLTKDRRQLLFARKLALETRLVGWCLKEQYEDFFVHLQRLLASAVASLAQKTARNSASRTDVTGGTGGSSPASE